MKTRTTQRRPFWAALAVVASLFLALLVTAPGVQANTGAGATIFNTVQIDYNDAGGTQSYHANASTYTTVNLVQATLTLKGRPTPGSPGTTNPLPAGQTIDSAATATYLISLTSNANGNDPYDLSNAVGTITNMTSSLVTYETVKADGTTPVLTGNPSQVNIGASVIQAVGAGFIKIPGGSLATAGLTGAVAADGRVLVIDGKDYLISSVTAGNKASNTHVGATAYYDLGSATAEVYDTINLVANPTGANVAFTGAGVNVGDMAEEQVLVLVTVTGVVGSNHTIPGTVPFTFTAASHTVPADTANTGAITTTFNVSTVTVTKTVRNVTASGSFADHATGNPGDILEYQVVVNNPGGTATSVKAADAVPIYTQLVCGSGALGTAACSGTPTTDIIATITVGANTSNITYQSSDNECGIAPTGVGSGYASGFVETSALHFYMGTGCTGSAGGAVAAGATYTILYRVKMN
jgi:hypothetical protein